MCAAYMLGDSIYYRYEEVKCLHCNILSCRYEQALKWTVCMVDVTCLHYESVCLNDNCSVFSELAVYERPKIGV